MQAIEQIKASIEVRHAELLTQTYPAFSDAEMMRRRQTIDNLISAQQLDALIVVEALRAGTATGWITGWPVTAEAVTLIMPGFPRRMFIQHFNHLPLARKISRDTDVIWGAAGGLLEAAKAISDGLAGRRGKVGVIGRLPMTQADTLTSRFNVVDMNSAYFRMRLIKSEEELRWLELAAELTDLAASALAQGARPGLNERQLSALVQTSYLEYGATNFIHYFLATSMEHPDAAVPRQYPSGRSLRLGDVLSSELSVDYWGYTGQLLRTYFIGRKPNALYRDLHAIADEVLDSILELIHPGVHVSELVAASHRIEEGGFTIIDDLIHGYGGGYLPPVAGSRSRPAAGGIPDMTLEAGMTLVVQPNVVTKDWNAGMQTGQMVVVTETGVRSLQKFPRGYLVIGAA